MFSRTKEDIKNDIFILRERVARVERDVERIQTNGVATAINKLNQEVFEKTKKTNSTFGLMSSYLAGETFPREATLAAKVDAIIDYLGLEVNVEPERVETLPAKVKAKKTKKGRK